MLTHMLILLQEMLPEASAVETKRPVTPDVLRNYLVTWTGFSILILLVALIAWWFLSSWARRRIAVTSGRPRRRRAIKDAWIEAGKRAKTPPPEGPAESADEDEPDEEPRR